MKKAKKILSLILVVALALGMMAFNTGAASAKNVGDYLDADKITYKEAVDVLTALGVLLGDDNGFRPDDFITREEAAKIITYILIGKTAGDNLATAHKKSSFTDVETERWSNPYIEYCFEQGIILGYGDGTFGPTDYVTGAQMVKMLLMALGYGKNSEFTGEKWQLASIIKGQETRILDTDADYTKPATREEIAQYTFNTLKNRIANYNSVFDQYFTTEGWLTDGAPNITLGESVFDLTSRTIASDGGRSQHYWRVRANRITDNYDSGMVLGSFIASPGVTKGSLFNDYTWGEPGSAITFTVNGFSIMREGVDGEGDPIFTPTLVIDIAQRGDTTPYGINILLSGAFVELIDYNFDGQIDHVCATYEYLAEVTNVSTANGTVNLRVHHNADDFKNISNVPATGFASGDFVVVVPNLDGDRDDATSLTPDDKIISIEEAETITEKIEASAAPGLTISGKLYSLSGLMSDSFAFDGTTFDANYTVYLDTHGSILGVQTDDTVAALLNYVYLNGVKLTPAGTFSDGEVKVSVTHVDGKTEILNVPITRKAGDVTVPDPAGGAAISIKGNDETELDDEYAAGWYSYSINSTSGAITLRDIDPEYTIALSSEGPDYSYMTGEAKKSKITLDADGTPGGEVEKLATNATVYSNVVKGVQSVYTGFANFPATDIEITGADGDPKVLLVFADAGEAGDDEPGDILTHIYVLNGAAEADVKYGIVLNLVNTTGDGAKYNVYTADGVIESDRTTDPFAPGDIVTIDDDNAITVDGDVVEDAEVAAIAKSWIAIDGDATYIFADDCLFADATGAAIGANKGAAVQGSKPSETDTVNYLLNDDDQVVAIVIVDA